MNLIGFGMQMVLFLIFYIYDFVQGVDITMGWRIVVSFFVSIVVVLVGLVMFNRTQRTCVDIL